MFEGVGWVQTYLASTILPSSFESAVIEARWLLHDGTGRAAERTLQRIIELAERHDPSLDMFALIQMLLRLLVFFAQIDFDRDHLHSVISAILCTMPV